MDEDISGVNATANAGLSEPSLVNLELSPEPMEVPDATVQKSPAKKARTPRKRAATAKPKLSVDKARERAEAARKNPILVSLTNLTKRYDEVVAADAVTLDVHQGSFYGIVGPNGAGKTTVLSMISGLNRPTKGTVTLAGNNIWLNPEKTKRMIGTLPDRLRLFERLTGAQLLHYTGILFGLSDALATERTKRLGEAFALENALNRPVSSYSVGMQKKIALAAAMIHAPRLLVLDEPFEAIDPVSVASLIDLLEKFVQSGGSVIVSSHSLDVVQRTCDHVAIIKDGKLVAHGTVDEVRDGKSLQERFDELTHAEPTQGAMEWLFRSSSSE